MSKFCFVGCERVIGTVTMVCPKGLTRISGSAWNPRNSVTDALWLMNMPGWTQAKQCFY